MPWQIGGRGPMPQPVPPILLVFQHLCEPDFLDAAEPLSRKYPLDPSHRQEGTAVQVARDHGHTNCV